MKIIPPYLRIYQQILKDLENAFPFLNVPKPKAGRKPKLTDTHIAAILILSYKVKGAKDYYILLKVQGLACLLKKMDFFKAQFFCLLIDLCISSPLWCFIGTR